MADPASYTENDWSEITPAATKAKLENIENGIKTNNDALVAETDAGRAMTQAADAAAQRSALGLGDSATKNVGTGAGDVAAGNAPAGAVTTHESTYAHANLPTADEKAALTADYANLNKIVPTQVALAQAERDINELERTIQQGQGAMIDVDDYGIVSLDARATGRANPTIEGRTATQLVTNGDFSGGTTGWASVGFTGALAVSAGELSHTITDVQAYAGISLITENKRATVNAHKYFISLEIKPFRAHDVWLFIDEVQRNTNISVTANIWNLVNLIYTSDGAGSLISIYDNGVSLVDMSVGSVTRYRNIKVLDLTAIYGAGNEPSAADCAKIFSYFDGTDSVALPARMRSVGRNLFNKQGLRANTTISTTDGLAVPASGGTAGRASSDFMVAEYNEGYAFSAGFYYVFMYDKNKNYLGYMGTDEAVGSVFTRTLDKVGTKFIKTILLPGYIANDLQIENSSSVTAYEPYEDTALYINETSDLRSVPAIEDEIKIVNGELVKVQNVSTPAAVLSGVAVNTTNYPTAKNAGKWVNELTAGGTEVGTIGTDSTAGAGQLRFELATPIITTLQTSGALQAKRNGTVYFEPWYEGSHQTNADGEITLPFAGTISKVYGYDESMVEYELDPSEYALVGTTLTITGAVENEVFYVELSRSEPLSPLMNVNVLNNLVVPTTVNAATYTVLDGDHTLLVAYSATGACAITIPSALIAKYIRLCIKDSGGSANVNNITIGTEGEEKIDGADTYVINAAKGSVELASDGANLFVVG